MRYVFQEQEKAEKVSKRESTLNEAASSTRELRELLDQHTDTGTLLELSDDVKVGTFQPWVLSPSTGEQYFGFK